MPKLGKKTAFFLILLLAPRLTAAVAWADLSDPCEGTGGPGSYQNLTQPDEDYVGWGSPPDGSYLCQRSNRQKAAAVYHSPGAERVTVALYSRYGSYASGEGEDLARGGEETPLRYHASSGEVYCMGRRMAYDAEEGVFVFLEGETPSGLSDYGLSVYASSDGQDYARVPVELLSAETEGGGAYYYEVYEALLDEGTNYVKLTLTDQSSIQIVGRGDRYEFESKGGFCLASVEIEGEAAESAPDPEPPEGPDNNTGPGDWGDGQPPEPDDRPWVPPVSPSSQPPPEEPSWGPNLDPDQGPAFEEEAPQRRPESSSQPPAAPSSASGSAQKPPSSSGKGQSGKASSSGGAGEGEEQEPVPQADGMISGKRALSDPSPPGGRELPLWRRGLEPEAVTMLLFSTALIAAALRILWRK